ncbi:LytR family transcriptional regulator [Clostridium sp. 2-1]|uniref:LCP family protein n=1 Tax=Clostridium TaxID=1485 RepID=UPI000CDA2D23|nr:MULTISPECIES: LCP family protein [Clostridium]MBN7572943.1 LCP family protein [Clostridium beijerinckii]MBN7578255.1 LCP family protein [Clostridium beijerinckii]MBN7582717.1 LCP family protein [Clostridium beijerinckii]MBO0520361.1 LCP family protein [Clostridium beijerinckii]POO92655.1 LytR family transcriptional regulator [Clostridium sp. 2-1]
MRRKTNKKRDTAFSKIFKKSNDSTTVFEKLVLGIISLIITFVIVSMVSGVYALMKVESKSMPSGASVSFNQPVNILLLGMDIGDPKQVNNQSIKRTDTIIVANYNPQTKSIRIVSIPRDTLININDRNVKINSAYAIGGYPKIKSEVENLLNININYIVKVDYNAFREIIDAIGGIEMKIDRNMIYDDEGQNLHINFKAGETVTLDGKKAEEFFRWRKNNDGSGLANGDLDRIENQQKFISKVIEKCTSPFVIFRAPKIITALGDNVETNLSPTDILGYGFKFIGIKKENVTMATVSGTPKTINGESFLIVDKNENKDILSSLTSSSVSNKSAEGVAKDDIRIKVLNATKINGLAAKVAKELSDAGYTKVDTGNTELSDKSEILSNDADKLKTIKQDLNIKENDEKENKKEYKDYDVIIILGKDFETFGK